MLSVSEQLSLIKEKKDLLNEMLLITENQAKITKEEEFEEIEKILDKKDLIIDKINDIDLKLSGSNLEDEKLSDLNSQIKDILNKIKILDDANNKFLSKVTSKIGESLKEVRESKRAMNKYGNSDPYQAFASQGGTLFIDQDS